MYRRHQRIGEEHSKEKVEERSPEFDRPPKDNSAKYERCGSKHNAHSNTGKRARQSGPQSHGEKRRIERPFSSVRVRIVLGVAALVLCAIVLWGPIKLGGTLLYVFLSVLFGYALVASIHAWHTASGPARSRAGIFALAFGARDICWGIAYGVSVWMLWAGTYQVVDPEAPGALYIIYALGSLLAVPLIAYGILRTQLFDIDLRIRWTIKQSTVAAVFVAVFYLVTEGADRLLSSELGNWIGLLASALLVFFLAPLQRLAERIATLAMPNTQNTPEYAAYKKLQVYEAALEEALPGGISEKERALLNHLRNSLEIALADAMALEQDLQLQLK